jgi:hypothetical protein
MIMLFRPLSLGVLVFATAPALAGPGMPAAAKPPMLPVPAAANSADAVAGALRTYLIHSLPTVLYEKSPGWGQTKAVATGLKWSGKGLDIRAHVMHAERNDGKWRKIQVTAPNLANTLTVTIQNIQQPDRERTTFDLTLAVDVRVDYEVQDWKAGVRLYSGNARARLRVKLVLACEASSRVEWSKGSLPEVVFRLRIVKANTSYEHFVLEHVAGVGGDAAKLIGDAVRQGIHKWHPSIEQNLLSRANGAIEKAGDSKEIHVGLGTLMKTKALPLKIGDSKPASPPGGKGL